MMFVKIYGILERILELVVDNASNNNTAVEHLLELLRDDNIDVYYNGYFMHGRCLCHIMNLSAGDGLAEIKIEIEKLRELVKSIRSSPKQEDIFNNLANLENVPEGKARPALYVATRWNSCLHMLLTSRPYASTFIRYGKPDAVPSDVEWEKIDVISKILAP